MFKKMDLRLKRIIFWVSVGSSGLYAIHPFRELLSPLFNFDIMLGITPIFIMGAITLLYLYGVLTNKW